MFINGKEYPIAPGADLNGADLRRAELRSADLRGADLRGANLSDANLRDADLRGANLSNADLSDANLGGANLSDADLSNADLRRADLGAANLSGADLRGADLGDADLRGAKNVSPLAAARLSILPAGVLTGFKKLENGVICEISIPADAKRSNATGRKCRCACATVISGEGVSQYDKDFVYSPGLVVTPREPFDEDRWNECGSGIHFFITREEAEAY